MAVGEFFGEARVGGAQFLRDEKEFFGSRPAVAPGEEWGAQRAGNECPTGSVRGEAGKARSFGQKSKMTLGVFRRGEQQLRKA